jgi:p38 MAP kinase
MAEFVRAQIFGTTFEITSRYVAGTGRSGEGAVADSIVGIPIFSLLGWELSDLSGMYLMNAQIAANFAHGFSSSAKDQLTGQAVAVKKIMKPFSTPVLAKRTYRELKLLKHLKHENVSLPDIAPLQLSTHNTQVISLSDIFISPLEDM